MARPKTIPETQTEPVTPPVEKSEKFDKAYFDKIISSGTDLIKKGAWQKLYAHFLDQIFGIRKKTVLDLGCAFGAISSSMADYQIKVYANDISNYAMNKSPFSNIEKVESPCWDLSKVPSNSIDFIHSMFMFNYIPDENCRETFKEMHRVAKNGAIIFVVLNFANTRYEENGEIFRPKSFYDMFAKEFGLLDGNKTYYHKMMNAVTPGWDFMRKYQWPFLLYKVVKE